MKNTEAEIISIFFQSYQNVQISAHNQNTQMIAPISTKWIFFSI